MTENTHETDFDLLVIGAGSGGLATSKRAASLGAKVAVVESSRVGGTCVIRGCIPKKLMVYASSLGPTRELAKDYGWQDTLGQMDWNSLKSMRDNVVNNLESMHERNLARAGVTLLRGEATIVSPRCVRVAGRDIPCKRVVIATGAKPTLPELPGLEHAIDSDGFWQLETQPKKALVVGAGYIALELACVLHGLGTETHVLVRQDILRGFDREIADHLESSLIKSGLHIHRPVTLLGLEKHETTVSAKLQNAKGEVETMTADTAVLFATGRHPHTTGLGLENVGIQLGDRGEIIADQHDATGCDNIFAIGDVTLKSMLTPTAIQCGRLLADRLYATGNTLMDYQNIPTAIFSQPPVATVGLTQEQAYKQLGLEPRVYRSEFGGLLYSPTPKERTVRSLMKLVVHPETEQVLGCHMVGPDAAEIIQGFAVAIQAGATKADFDRTVAVHPSSAEEFVLMS